MWPKYAIKQILALLLILVLLGLLIYALWPFAQAFFGALILFVICRPAYRALVNRLKFRKGLAAAAVIVASIFVILLPLSFLASVLVKEVEEVAASAQAGWGVWSQLEKFLPSLKFDLALGEQLSRLGSTAAKFVVGAAQAIGLQVISYVIMYFLLFFLLTTDETKLKQAVLSLMPFSHDNTLKLQREFRRVTYATLITTGLIALIQGSLLAIGFAIFGISGPVLWGLVAAVASFVPIVGTPVVWVPAALIQLLGGNIFAGIGLVGWGLIVSNVDNLLRPFIQKKVGQIHPFISLLGAVVGISLFGLIGIIIGPLLLSYFLLMLKMFKEEYVAD